MARLRYADFAATADGQALLQSKVLASLDEPGFAIVEGFLSGERVAAMKAELTAVLDETDKRGRNHFEGFVTRRMYALFAKTRSFDDLAVHPLVLGVVEAVLGTSEVLLSSPTGIEIGPGEQEQLLHRDDGKYPFQKSKEIVMNTMWALDDFTADNGATVVYPGSHFLLGERNGAGDDVPLGVEKEERMLAVMPKGSVMFYRGSILHGGGANNTETPRLGVILEYVAAWLRPQENHILAVPKNVVRGLPDRLQELLGYFVSSPFIGYVDGLHPKRSLL